MVALQIRDVPDDVREVLAARAKQKGQSLQAFLRDVVIDEAKRADNLAVLERAGRRRDGSRLTATETVRVLDEARARRDRP